VRSGAAGRAAATSGRRTLRASLRVLDRDPGGTSGHGSNRSDSANLRLTGSDRLPTECREHDVVLRAAQQGSGRS